MLWVRVILHNFGVASSAPWKCFVTIKSRSLLLIILFSIERTKHIEVDCHFIRDLLVKKQIATSYVRSDSQLSDILMKPLSRAFFTFLSPKRGMFDLYALA